MGYIYLSIAIVAEVIGTLTLKSSNGFTNVIPSNLVVVGYGLAFYFLALVLRTIPVGVAYAIWAGVGIALIAVASAVIHRQVPDLPAIIGMLLIISGVVTIKLFSDSSVH